MKLIVTFTGPAGGGKSTLIPLVAKNIREHTNGALSSKAIIKNTGNKTALIKIALKHPGLILTTIQLNKSYSGRYGGIGGFFKWYKKLISHTFIKISNSSNKMESIYLVDQGILQPLKKCTAPVPVDVLKKIPLPDIDFVIQANPSTSIIRQINRSKPALSHELVYHNERGKKAYEISKLLLEGKSSEETRGLLLKWSEKFCRPQLSNSQIETIVEEAASEASDKNNQKENIPRNLLEESLRKLGVAKIVYENNHASAEKAAFIITKKIIEIAGNRVKSTR